MDHLSVSDKNYDKKYNDMQERLDKLYDEITDIEDGLHHQKGYCQSYPSVPLDGRHNALVS